MNVLIEHMLSGIAQASGLSYFELAGIAFLVIWCFYKDKKLHKIVKDDKLELTTIIQAIKEGQKKLEKRVDHEVSAFNQHIALMQSDIQAMRTEAGIHHSNIKEWITDLKGDIKMVSTGKSAYH